jgi:hypothetical protein
MHMLSCILREQCSLFPSDPALVGCEVDGNDAMALFVTLLAVTSLHHGDVAEYAHAGVNSVRQRKAYASK